MGRLTPKVGLLVLKDGLHTYKVVGVDYLVGTEGRFIVSVQRDEGPVDHISDRQFHAAYRSMWTRYDMIEAEEIIGEPHESC